jgi:hypothetical protein
MAKTTYNEGERLVALETKMDTVLDNQRTQTDKFDTLNNKLEALLPTYATKSDVEKLKTRNTVQTWITGSLSAILGSVLTFLVMYFITNISK